MASTVAPEFTRFVAALRRAPPRPMAEGELGEPLVIDREHARPLLQVAARRASGLVRPSRRNEVVWVDGDSELAVVLNEIDLHLGTGFVEIALPVRCDQTGAALVRVSFACGAPDRPAGLYASTLRRPQGPELVVSVWGDALVAFAWQCLLGLVTGIAAAAGKDTRGNLLVPVELVASERGLQVFPMARHRFAGSSGLRPR